MTHLAKIKKEGRVAATLVTCDRQLAMLKGDIGRKPIAEITAPMMLRWRCKVEAKGNSEIARKTRLIIGSIFHYGIATGVAEQDPTEVDHRGGSVDFQKAENIMIPFQRRMIDLRYETALGTKVPSGFI